MAEKKSGWAWPLNSRKAHYFRATRSLCGRWAMFTTPDLGEAEGRGPDDCAGCWKVLEREAVDPDA